MIDIHSHILPGIDDGASDMEQAIRMAKLAVQDGITTIVATPHFQEDYFKCEEHIIKQKIELVTHELEKENITLRILPGMEPHIQPNFLRELKQGSLLTLAETGKYVLLELPFDLLPPQMENIIYELCLEGYVPIIPHPERTVPFQKRPELFYELIKKGAIAQITAGSLTGFYGDKVKQFTKHLLEFGLVHLVASDAHDDIKRPPLLSKAYQEIEALAGEEVVHWMKDNAEAVVQGKHFYQGEPRRPKRRKFWVFN